MKVVFPGSFDPITLGHINIINRIIKHYNCCEILVLNNVNKKHLLTIEERIELIKKIYKKNNLIISSYNGLLADYIVDNNIDLIIRGVRNIIDFEVEKQNAYINKKLCGVDTILLFSDIKYEHFSSTVVKDIYFNNGNIKDYVDPNVIEFFNDKFRRKK